MGRSNVIIVGSVVLAPLILGLESYALFRAHHRRAAHVAETLPEELPTAPPETAASSAPLPVHLTTALTDDLAVAGPEPAGARLPPSALEQQRQIIRSADELTFDVLSFPEPQRNAIRAIDDAYVRAARAGDAFAPDGVDQARRAAIAALLGRRAMRAFRLAERKAERGLRRQFPSQSVSQR